MTGIPDRRETVEEILTRSESIKFSPEQIRQAFEDEDSAKLAVDAERWLPDADYVHEQLFRLLRPHLTDGGTVLDLGAGTGRLSKFLLERFPEITITLLDFSETMLGVASETLSEFEGRYRIIHQDFFDDQPLPFFDAPAVVSAFAIHHGTTDRAYELLYQRIFEALVPGGVFVNLDHVAGATRQLIIENAKAWRNFLDFDGSLPTDRFLLGSFAEDHPIPIDRHFTLMADAGFADLDVIWKKAIFALYVGRRPEIPDQRGSNSAPI